MRAETSLIQTIGRAARNISGKVILYGDEITKSMKFALDETARRRKIQIAYNKKNNITPKTIVKDVKDINETIRMTKKEEINKLKEFIPRNELPDLLRTMEEDMLVAATALDFERAAEVRDKIRELKDAFKLP